MEIVTYLKTKICIPEDKKVTVGNIVSAVKSLQMEKRTVEEIIKAIDQDETEGICGKPNTRGNGKKQYQRAGTKNRHPVTSVGRLNLKLHRVKDTHKAEDMTFKPVERRIEFDGRKIYQEDISMISSELATKMTYRDAVREGMLFTTDMPSASTINRRIIAYGKKMKEFNKKRIKDASVNTAFADGTKCHSQEEEISKNGINVTLGLDEKGRKVLLDASVNKGWDEDRKGV